MNTLKLSINWSQNVLLSYYTNNFVHSPIASRDTFVHSQALCQASHPKIWGDKSQKRQCHLVSTHAQTITELKAAVKCGPVELTKLKVSGNNSVLK